MASVLQTLKLQAAELLWGFADLSATADVREVRRSLAERGWSVIPGFVDSAAIDGIVADARRLYESHPQHVAHESNGSDARIYGADRICASLRLEREMSVIDRIASSYYWPSATVNFQLLGWIRHREGNLGSGAGWHRDSPFSHQFKALLYLSDVTEDNGPFEFIEGSHRRASLLTAAGSLGVPLAQYRFSDEQIARLQAAGVLPQARQFTGSKGTLLLVDTRGLHRGRPLRSGERLALTRYYFASNVPDEFTSRHSLTKSPPQ
jgi:phytanoyl-CoA dioxygenase PhyH